MGSYGCCRSLGRAGRFVRLPRSNREAWPGKARLWPAGTSWNELEQSGTPGTTDNMSPVATDHTDGSIWR